MCPPVFGRSVNPISARGVDYAHHITTCPPPHSGSSDLPTAQQECKAWRRKLLKGNRTPSCGAHAKKIMLCFSGFYVLLFALGTKRKKNDYRVSLQNKLKFCEIHICKLGQMGFYIFYGSGRKIELMKIISDAGKSPRNNVYVI